MNSTSIDFHKLTWSFAPAAANQYQNPQDVKSATLAWLPARVPGTVAQSLRLNKQEKSALFSDMDQYDWCYQCEFNAPEEQSCRCNLDFEGLATLADIWLNNELILSTSNMFVPENIDISNRLQTTNQLIICFRSSVEFLNQKRPRPQWKTNLVNHQQLRWLRSSLLGRIPGWCPPITPIGPWRNITLQISQGIELRSARINNVLNDQLEFDAAIELYFPVNTTDTEIQLQVGQYTFNASAQETTQEKIICTIKGKLNPEDCWWPHTHGTPTLLKCALIINQQHSQQQFDLGVRGFKQLYLNRSDGLVDLQINKTPIFCRGACWTISDLETLAGTTEGLYKSLKLAQEAGMNMLRVGGTMVYESDEFYRLCDQLGIMVWQDFMFANMDYPINDEIFFHSIMREAQTQTLRLSKYACISVYCGSSEVQQQAAMMGQSREHWSNHFFDRDLKHICTEYHPGIPYFPSTPCEGAMPFSVADGLSHYYGVGAYKRRLEDAVLAQVKFTPETLGFANIPEPNTIEEVLHGNAFTTHHPAWKQSVPRDSSAGWDFEDIRDFYVQLLFQQDPIQLRSQNPQRYLELSRIVSGEVMQRTIAVWRTGNHPCRGALIWFYKDLIPGAGWGLLDSNNQPKAAYYAIKHASKNPGIYFIDKGLDGLILNIVNEIANPKTVKITLKAFQHNNIETLSIDKIITLQGEATEINISDWIGYFSDLNYCYGFGPKQQDIVYAYMEDAHTGAWLDDDTYFVGNYNLPQLINATINTEIFTYQDEYFLRISSEHFLQFLRIDINTHECSDNYFHLAPKVTRIIKLTAKNNQPTHIKGYIEAINLVNPYKFSQ